MNKIFLFKNRNNFTITISILININFYQKIQLNNPQFNKINSHAKLTL